jgi:Mlc titration factor MtfA (ptsG expression regulator)
METQNIGELRAVYELFQRRHPPRGFGLICEETQLLVDLLDGDMSGVVQQFLAGKDIKAATADLQVRAEATQENIDKCTEKLAEVTAHFELVKEMHAKLKACLRGEDNGTP